jgi:uncharacterized protein
MESITEKKTATFTHLSALTQYCIPLGNYIFPILIWTSKKDKSEFVDYNGKQVLNFQLSLLLYSLVLIMIAIPAFLFTVFSSMNLNDVIENHETFLNHINLNTDLSLITVGLTAMLIFIILKFLEFFLIIYAAVKTSNGELYKYPLSIPFIK